MAMNLGVPFKLLKELCGRTITVEISGTEMYRGELLEVEENLSVCLKDVKATLIDGKEVEMKSVYIKGGRIRLISLPESAAKESLRTLTKPPSRGGRGGFRGGRGGFRSGRDGDRRNFGGSGGKPSYDRRRY